MNIRANLEIIESKNKTEFQSIEDAIEQLGWRTEPFSDEEMVKLRTFLEHTFVSQAAPPFVRHGQSIWALVWWKKGGR